MMSQFQPICIASFIRAIDPPRIYYHGRIILWVILQKGYPPSFFVSYFLSTFIPFYFVFARFFGARILAIENRHGAPFHGFPILILRYRNQPGPLFG